MATEIPVQQITAHHKAVDLFKPGLFNLEEADNLTINGLLEAAANATEEAIYHAICMPETMTGNMSRTVGALPLRAKKEIFVQFQECENLVLKK
ncbi:hypothetical protein ACLX1H_007913 [Fusarium chlamydosporum]